MEELEIMGRQLEAMKQSLDTQQIINKKLLCKLIRKRSSWLNSFVISEIIALPLVALIFVSYCSLKGISQWYTLSFILFAAIDTAIDWRTVRIPGRMFGTASILELKRRIIRQKKERSDMRVASSDCDMDARIHPCRQSSFGLLHLLPLRQPDRHHRRSRRKCRACCFHIS